MEMKEEIGAKFESRKVHNEYSRHKKRAAETKGRETKSFGKGKSLFEGRIERRLVYPPPFLMNLIIAPYKPF